MLICKLVLYKIVSDFLFLATKLQFKIYLPKKMKIFFEVIVTIVILIVPIVSIVTIGIIVPITSFPIAQNSRSDRRV